MSTNRRVTEDDLNFIREHGPAMTTSEMAKELGFTPATIGKYAAKIGITPKRRKPGPSYQAILVDRTNSNYEDREDIRPDGPPDMVKVTHKDCQKCMYGGNRADVTGCNWYLDTGIRRGCPVGWCNHFTPGNRRKKAKSAYIPKTTAGKGKERSING